MRNKNADSSNASEENQPQPFPVRFRQDLIVTNRQDAEGNPLFLIKDPVTKAAYNFGEQEYFLCQAMDGLSSAEEIQAAFQKKFDLPISRQDLDGLGDYLRTLKVVEEVAVPAATEDGEPVAEAEVEIPDDDLLENRKENQYRHKFYNPEKIFDWLLPIFRPLKMPVMVVNLLLFPLTPWAFYTYFVQIDYINFGLRYFGNMVSFLGSVVFMLCTVNLLRSTIQGVIITSYGLRVKETGIRREFGMIPHLYISKNGVRNLSRSAKLWIYGTTLLVRLNLFVYGILVWSITHHGGGLVPALAAIFAQSGLGGLIFQIVPHRQTEGQLWMCNFFGWPHKLVYRALDVVLLTIKREPLPTSITPQMRTRYLIFMSVMFWIWLYVFIKMTYSFTYGLEKSFPGLFGASTSFVMMVIVLYFMCTFIPHKFAPVIKKHGSGGTVGHGKDDKPPSDPRKKYFIIGLALLILIFPIPFRPGGEINVQAPAQQPVAATVTGKITKVFYQGGDGQLLKRGVTVALMESDQIESTILALKEQIDAQEGILGKAKAELALLLAGARQEDIDAARAKLDHAVEGVKIASKDLDSAKLTNEYNQLVVVRLEKLYVQGGYAYLDIEEARKKAEISAVDVEKAERNVVAAQAVQAQAKADLDLVLAGAKPQDIDAARQSVAAAEANVRRIEQQLKYYEQQLTDSPLLMPLDGYIVDSYLFSKIGSYLKQGENFCSTQTSTKPLVAILLPEYDTGSIVVGAKAEVKLWVKPDSPFTGKVLSITPSSTETIPGETTVIYRVTIELDASTKEVRPGMTGYGKIYAGHAPIGVIITRPIVRFIIVEVWSWLP